MLPGNLGLIFRASLRKIITSRRFFLHYSIALRSPIGFILLHQRTVLRHATSEAVLEFALIWKRLHHYSFGVWKVYLTFVRRLVNGCFLHFGQVVWATLRIVLRGHERLLDGQRYLVDILEVSIGLNFWVSFRIFKGLNLIKFKVCWLLLGLLSIQNLGLTSFVTYGFLLKIFAVVGFINVAAAHRDSRSEFIKTLEILVILTLFDGTLFGGVNISNVVDSLLDLAEKHIGVVILLLLGSLSAGIRVWLTILLLGLIETEFILHMARVLALRFTVLETKFYALWILLLFWLLGFPVFAQVMVVLVVEYGRSWQFVGDLLEWFNLELFDVWNTSQIHEILALKRVFTILEWASSDRILVVLRHLRSLDARLEISFIDKINI